MDFGSEFRVTYNPNKRRALVTPRNQYIHICVYVYVYICIYVYVCICVYVYILVPLSK